LRFITSVTTGSPVCFSRVREHAQRLFANRHRTYERAPLSFVAGPFKLDVLRMRSRFMEKRRCAWLADARKQTGLPVVTEVMNLNDVKLVEEYADIIQVRRSQYPKILIFSKWSGKTKKAVLLKRGMSTTIQEWLLSAEYVM